MLGSATRNDARWLYLVIFSPGVAGEADSLLAATSSSANETERIYDGEAAAESEIERTATGVYAVRLGHSEPPTSIRRGRGPRAVRAPTGPNPHIPDIL